MNTLFNVEKTVIVQKELSCNRLASIGLPDKTTIGVSTSSAHKTSDNIHWYAMRTTYGREKKAYDYIISKSGTAFYPVITICKQVNGKIVLKEQSRIPNIFFVKGTEEEVQGYAYDNVHLPFLRFYYKHHREGLNIIKTPLIVPETQINYLQILCRAESEDVLLVPNNVNKFQNGEPVRIINGVFKGIEGKISRWHGQQRVGVEVEGLCTFATAYIPTAFVEKINKQ